SPLSPQPGWLDHARVGSIRAQEKWVDGMSNWLPLHAQQVMAREISVPLVHHSGGEVGQVREIRGAEASVEGAAHCDERLIIPDINMATAWVARVVYRPTGQHAGLAPVLAEFLEHTAIVYPNVQ